jgi:aspartate-semialdehyde dehydrogenase
MPSGPGKFYRVSIVGASSLLAKELKQVLEDRRFPASDTVLLDESVMAGTLTEAGGEATFIRTLEEDSFEGSEFVFFAGTAADAEQNWRTAKKSGATVIDLTGALGRSADSLPCVIPSLGPGLPEPLAAGNGAPARRAYSSPSPPVIIACTLALGWKAFQTRSACVLLFPPVSERGQAGIEELESQTTSLLSFREISKPVFDAQVAFNLLARYGQESKPSLAEVREAVAREVAAYLAGRAPAPAIQLLQAPVFYGYAFAAYAETASPAGPAEFEAAFTALGVKMGAAGDAPPSNVSVAGESEIHIARIERDPNVPSGAWIWGVADNLRLAATNAVRIAEELIGNRAAR